MEFDKQKQMLDSMIFEENIKGKPYLDGVLKWTVGIGHNLDDRPITQAQADRLSPDRAGQPLGPQGQQADGRFLVGHGRDLMADPLTEDESLEIWKEDMDVAESEVRGWLGKDIYDNLSPTHKHALIDMSFNMGLPALSTFKNFRAAVQRGDFENAGAEIKDSDYYRDFVKWQGVEDNRAQRNINRIFLGDTNAE